MTFVEDLADAVRRIMDRCGADGALAEAVARELVAWACRTYGGERVYIPATRHRLADRNAAIRREFNGRNHAELARRYRVSRRTIYRILSR